MAVVRASEEVLADVIARCEKSVVAIARVRRDRPEEAVNFEIRPDPFGRRPIRPTDPEPTDPDFIPNEYGTGVVLDRRGLILTAYHVLAENSDYYVTTHQRKVYRARIKAADPRSDLAVLAIDAADLVPIVLGDADRLRKGHWVIALGNPYAIARDGQASASWGMVSNLARKAPPEPSGPTASGKRTLHHFGTLIQTDAKLNLGTSGGPLLDRRGEMVGLTVAVAALSGLDESAGYAIPIDATFRRVIDTLRQGREVEYGFLGLQPDNLAAAETLAGKKGIRVARIVPGTPAEKYGMKLGDLVTAVDGYPIREADAFVLAVGRLPVDSLVRLSVLRDDRSRTVDVQLAKFPVVGWRVVTSRPAPWRGMRVEYPTAMVDSDPGARGGMGFFDDGVIIAEVEENSPAWQAGLRPKMRVDRVDRTTVRTPREFRRAVEGQSGPVRLYLAAEETPLRVVAPEF